MSEKGEKRSLHLKWVGTFVPTLLVAFSIVSCSEITVPRLSFEEEPQARLPVSVTYAFDRQLTDATLQVDACGLPHTIATGSLITEEFVKTGQKRFVAAGVSPLGGQAISGPRAKPITIELQLVQQSFTPKDTIGEQDRYLAEVSLQLLAIYKDDQGSPIAQTPLSYLDNASMWAPNLSGQSSSCATGQFDEEVRDAAETLAIKMADDMAKALPQLYGQAPPAPSIDQSPLAIQGQVPPTLPTPSPLSFRTMLQDGNDNLILEGGEKLVLQVQTINKGTLPISSAQIELDGNPVILQAFTQVATFPLTIDVVQPGQTTTTEIRGVMPNITQETRGKLIVSVNDGDGRSIGSHNILAAIQPGSLIPQREGNTSPNERGLGGKHNHSTLNRSATDSSPYFALIIGLDSYRDPWRHMPKKKKTQAKALIDALLVTGSFPKNHIRVLLNDHATKTDIEEGLFSWASPQLQENSIFFVYFAGQAIAKTPKGEVYLAPYEGTPARSKGLISLRVLQKYLSQLPNKTTLLFLDSPLTFLNKGKIQSPNQVPSNIKWASGISTPSTSSPGKLIQIREKIRLSDPAKLWAGLLGRADQNGDQTITIGELLQDVQPFATITPPPNSNSMIESLQLTR